MTTFTETTRTLTYDVLVKARAIYAENPDHTPYGKLSNACPVALLDHAGDPGSAELALAEAAGLVPDGPVEYAGWRIAIIKWNAESTTEEVLAAFDRAIERTAPRGLGA